MDTLPRNEHAEQVIAALRRVIPRPRSELDFVSEYQLIVAVILSAQCTDERVNKVTPAFFEAYPGFQELAETIPEEVFPLIRSISYPNNKSKHLIRMAQMVQGTFGGRLPETQSELMKLPGVGRKTAQVVSSVAFADMDALPVDTHVFRVANRVGLVKRADTPLKVETGLKRILPRGTWGEAHHLLILHGRYTCTARSPKCDKCAIAHLCDYGRRLERLPGPIEGLDSSRGKYWCRTRNTYFDVPVTKRDRYGTRQVACPKCGSMSVFLTKTGVTTKKVRDYRVV